jgi:hypothetical protein
LTRANSRGNLQIPLRYNLFSATNKEGKILPNKHTQTAINKSLEKTNYASNLNKISFNLKDPAIKDKIKKIHIPSRSLNQSNLNPYISQNLFKSKINFK